MLLFGCTEDIDCVSTDAEEVHAEERRCAPHCRSLCSKCRVPICSRCGKGLRAYRGYGSVPMSLANDHYYGYVNAYIVRHQVTWLECAAASLCWSTIIVCYLEEPYGHLMMESMEGAQARTKVRGNLFSFAMPWEDGAVLP